MQFQKFYLLQIFQITNLIISKRISFPLIRFQMRNKAIDMCIAKYIIFQEKGLMSLNLFLTPLISKSLVYKTATCSKQIKERRFDRCLHKNKVTNLGFGEISMQ